MKARLVDLIGSSGIENATSAQPKNLASAPRRSPLLFFGGVAGDETSHSPKNREFESGFIGQMLKVTAPPTKLINWTIVPPAS